MKVVLMLPVIITFFYSAQAQNHVGIGTTTPLAGLHVADSSVLFSASGPSLVNPGKPPIEGAGRRLMWYVDKAALRAGYAAASEWNIANIGKYSFAAGYGSMASGNTSTSLGYLTKATGEYSIATGNTSIASAPSSSANGINSNATGVASSANGNSSIASGNASAAFGQFTEASGLASASFGNYTNARGAVSTAFGDNTNANANHSFVIGSFNEIATDMSTPNASSPLDRLFQIGNGSSGIPKNAVTVLRNGNVGIGVLNPAYILDVNGRLSLRHSGNTAGIWHNNSSNVETVFTGMKTDQQWGVYNAGWKFYFDISNGEAYKTSGSTAWIVASDARLKENVHPYKDGLQQLMEINPVWFNYTKQSGLSTAKPYVGVIAQDLKETAPYMVGNFTKDGEELLNVDNSAMTYMLINAIKEQQKQIELLKQEVTTLKNGK